MTLYFATQACVETPYVSPSQEKAKCCTTDLIVLQMDDLTGLKILFTITNLGQRIQIFLYIIS